MPPDSAFTYGLINKEIKSVSHPCRHHITHYLLLYWRTLCDLGECRCRFVSAVGEAPLARLKEAWVVDYRDQGGTRHLKTFERKREADAYHGMVAHDVRAGIHTRRQQEPHRRQGGRIVVRELRGGRARTCRRSMSSYRIVLDKHINPLIGAVKLSTLTVPMARTFEDRLRADRSPAMVRKIMGMLGSVLADAQERGLVAQNVVRSLRGSRRRDRAEHVDKRQKGKLKVGVDIPAPEEIKAIIAHLSGRWRPLLLTAIFTGLRASELRGLRWADVDLKRGELHVRQRADCYNAIGRPKSASGERTIPLAPLLVNTLREWKLACPKSDLDLAFPTATGRPHYLADILQRGWWPPQIAAGVINETGKAKYSGLHSLRHFYASWCINRRADGGLELPLKLVQSRLGHSTISMTADVYGHLFPRGDDGAELAAAEKIYLS